MRINTSLFSRFVLISLLALASLSFSQSVDMGKFPKRIILNLTADPAHSEAVTWRTAAPVSNPQVQVAPAIAAPKLDENQTTISAGTEQVGIGDNQSSYYHSTVIRDLQPGTLYAYRVGDGSTWSEWNQFRTAEDKAAPFKFVYFGDPQNDIIAYVSRIFREAYKEAPDAAFWLFTGDMVTNSLSDSMWNDLFYAAGWIPGMMPSIELPGNHSYPRVEINGEKKRVLAPLWRPQFTLPENGPAGLPETCYYVDYQGVRFVMLNGNEKLPEQAKWLDSVLADNPNRWTVAAIHQPLYSTAEGRDYPELRELFLPVFDKYGVDLVLQGHDHSYGRTYKLRQGKIVRDDEKGTVYVVSVSGPKVYKVKSDTDVMARLDTGRQLFQVITVSGGTLKYECRTVTGELHDSFELIK